MKIADPITPKVAAELDAWDGSDSDVVEIDRDLVDGADFANATRLSADASRIENSVLTGLSLDKLEMSDVVAGRLEAAALSAYKARMLRVELSDSRLTGSEFAEGSFEDCTFRNVKFDEAGFRFAKFKRVRFESCMLRACDFSSAKFEHVTFTGCDLEAANFVSASCKAVDVTGEDLSLVKGLLGLKGATISTEQLMQLAPMLAAELGFEVRA